MAYTARMIARDFKERHPDLWRRGVAYGISGWMSIELMIPGVGKIIYDGENDTIEWLEKWEDQQEVKQLEKEYRPEMYERFCSSVRRYMRNNVMTQQEFANYVGISRQSLSKYLLGDSIPKVSTMRRICERLHVDI